MSMILPSAGAPRKGRTAASGPPTLADKRYIGIHVPVRRPKGRWRTLKHVTISPAV
ncbi:hypothetical protein ACIP9H_42135 [Streptomyces sp. NPDC088732]|uniref:hypothetical protein n=1 Tax=Streptomyces sp. NPDC088732 TaxID=3365879 RepID=UPI0038013595